MTNARYGHITGAQGLVLGLAGRVLQFGDETDSVPESMRLTIMRKSHRALCNMTGEDFGFDLAAWDAYLCKTAPINEDYTDPRAWSGVSKAVRRLIGDSDRLRLVSMLESEVNT